LNKRVAALLASYKNVYSGGHHDVFCDGKDHIWVNGNSCGYVALGGETNIVKLRFGSCDCARWQQDWNK